MSPQSATAVLESEHRKIEKVAGILEDTARALESGAEASPELLYAAVAFIRSYADALHHGKEEALLFPALVRCGVPAQGCPVGGLRMEHQKGRAMVVDLEENITRCASGIEGARGALAAALRELAVFYKNHIWKEDFLLFPMAAKILPAEEAERLTGEFEKVDQERGPEANERYENLARLLGWR